VSVYSRVPVAFGSNYFFAISRRFHAYNIGLLASRASTPLFAPCTPSAVIRLLEAANVSMNGAHAVVLGRSDIVGNPVASMLRKRHATVTQCHSRSQNIQDIVRFLEVSANSFPLLT
jgi:methylenetetrahydrofolate dehydrogenase (NADP+) / methenyltetrahydrofolate cyclohydrolase / formyltetrahydrofolate synthetase